ncbi:T9SS type A sorting domain-containing protein [Aestuariibaculum sp. M13]|uniref:T9SS type A sorting domain-containing protein n=1 Tax=Aestuariibaculum sp. M13 TaxID=2967132 RepID=UPI002159E8E8|nr:T9SS type A sorting domain-containing protein [Aestuariibaculum sp. M13]MCR8667725.1 T9SS type A sorting domain-containing protein [Aestuariibaculum sp. M13]
MNNFTQRFTNQTAYYCWLSKHVKRALSLFVFMLFLFSVTTVKAQIIIPASTETKADFGTDGDVYNDTISMWPNTGREKIFGFGTLGYGTDDWFKIAPDGTTVTGAGVIDIFSASALAKIATIENGENTSIELGQSSPIYTTPEGDGRVWIDAKYFRDTYVKSGNDPDKTVFEQDINKNFDDPRAWQFKIASVPTKTDIIDVYGHLRRGNVGDEDGTNEWAFLGASTADADGSNHLDFEYYRKKIHLEPIDGPEGVSTIQNIVYDNPGEGEDCGHTAYYFDPTDGGVLDDNHGDILLSVDYKDGGRTAEVTLLVWIDIDAISQFLGTLTDFNNDSLYDARPFDFTGDFTPCTNSIEGDESNFGYAEIKLRQGKDQAVFTQLNNTGPSPAPYWGTIDSGNSQPVLEYPTDTFVEFAINATALGFDTQSESGNCESTLGSVMVKSRSSASWTSSLKDLGGPFNLGDKPVLEVSLAGGTACLDGDPVSLTAVPTPSADDIAPALYHYAWEEKTSSDPDVWSSVGVDSPTYPAATNVAGVRQYRVTVTSPWGCAVTTEPVNVVISAPPAPQNVPLSSCEGALALTTPFSTYNTQLLPDLTDIVIEWFKNYDAGTKVFSDKVLTLEDVQDLIAKAGFYTFFAKVSKSGVDCPIKAELQLTIIGEPDVDPIDPVTACDSYNLPAITGDGDYYTGPGGTGTMLSVGDPITSTQTIYVYAETGTDPNCYDEESFLITINVTPDVDPIDPVTACDSYNLPAITGDGDYYTGPGGTGTMLSVGDPITSTQTIYVYAETGTDPNCYDEESFLITINPTPSCNAYADNVMACVGAPITLHVIGSGGIGEDDQSTYSFVWSGVGSEYLDDATSANPTLLGTAPEGIYNLTVTVYDESSQDTRCSSTCNVQVEVYNCTPNCETGFAVKTEVSGDYTVVDEDYSSCFRNDGFNRWGWVNRIPASAQGGAPVEFDLYAGAGRCDLSKGTNTGTVTVEYNNDGTVQVCYNLKPGYVMSEAHVYIGCEPYPKTNKGANTVAPGQYSFNGGDLGYIQNYCTPVLENVSGDFYVIVHAVVCESYIPEGCTPYPASPEEGGIFDTDTSNGLPVVGCDVDTDGWGKVGDTKVTFTAYPVPFEEEVTVSYKFEYDTNVKIDVYDLKGAVVKKAVNNNYRKGTVDNTKLDLSRFDDQMFFVRLTTNKGTLVKKVVSSKRQQIKRQ